MSRWQYNHEAENGGSQLIKRPKPGTHSREKIDPERNMGKAHQRKCSYNVATGYVEMNVERRKEVSFYLYFW